MFVRACKVFFPYELDIPIHRKEWFSKALRLHFGQFYCHLVAYSTMVFQCAGAGAVCHVATTFFRFGFAGVVVNCCDAFQYCCPMWVGGVG